LVFALAALFGWAGAVNAQTGLIFSWQPVQKVQERMEKERVPGLFFFEAYDTLKDAYNWQFGQTQLQSQAKAFACTKIQGQLGGSSKMWGAQQKLADKWGVGTTSTIVLVAFDGYVLGTISQPVKRDELALYLKKMAAVNQERVKITEDSIRDLEQAEKWIGEEKFADAIRRTRMVIERGDRIDPKVIAKAQEVEKKLKSIFAEKFEAAKMLADDPAKKTEAKAALQSLVSQFAKLEEAKEAKELLKKLD
jgi:hypothetical protein